ncbi:MAG: SDR family oxidoreductase [Acidobacteria bacterium]|nr:SDR family oxidoreductase [Acidobacteriota bacterium]
MSLPLYARSALITGASQGLGLAIARAYVRAGASVTLCARDEAMLERARDEVASLAGPEQTVHAMRADVSNADDVSRLVTTAVERLGGLHVLVNNAGVYGPMGSLDAIDWAEWTRAMAINIDGSALPMRAVLPHFRKQRYGKIVQLSGGGATNPLPRIVAYAAAKAAIVRLAECVAVDVKDDGIDVNCIAPGALNTRMMDQLLEAGAATVGEGFYARMKTLAEGGTTPLEIGAALAVYLGSPESDGITGRLISAPWDPWERLQTHRDDLDGSDIYTLRRIVPKDRGKTWGDR